MISTDAAKNNRQVAVIGGGVAGMQTAIALAGLGIPSLLLEKEMELGGRVRRYSRLFPNMKSGRELLADLQKLIRQSGLIQARLGTGSIRIECAEPGFRIVTEPGGRSHEVLAIVLATGFEPFDASLQEQYGYGVYRNVITGTDMEDLLNPDGPTGGELRRPSDGQLAKNIALVFCVGSRNEQLGNNYCSRVCCSYSTKQAIEIKEKYPDARVTCFYIDIRTYGRGFEEMYRRAQEAGVRYIRGRVGECGLLPNGDIAVRAEDTLLGKPLQASFDLVSLSHGMTPCRDALELATMLGLATGTDGFFECRDRELQANDSTREGVFLAGAVSGLKPVADCISEGNAVAARVAAYLADIKRQRVHE